MGGEYIIRHFLEIFEKKIGKHRNPSQDTKATGKG